MFLALSVLVRPPARYADSQRSTVTQSVHCAVLQVSSHSVAQWQAPPVELLPLTEALTTMIEAHADIFGTDSSPDS